MRNEKMPKSYIRWQMNTEFIPTDPKVRGELFLKMLAMVKADMEAKSITKWGMCYDASGGYAFSKLGVQDLYTMLSKWTPYVEFDVKPVLNVDEVIESIKSLASG